MGLTYGDIPIGSAVVGALLSQGFSGYSMWRSGDDVDLNDSLAIDPKLLSRLPLLVDKQGMHDAVVIGINSNDRAREIKQCR